MARKRSSHSLQGEAGQSEAGKPSEAESKTAAANSSADKQPQKEQPQAEQPQKKQPQKEQSQPTVKKTANEPDDVEAIPVQSSVVEEESETEPTNPPDAPATNHPQQELEKTIDELKAALAKAHESAKQREQELLQQVDRLQGQLQAKQEQVEGLQKEKEQAHQLRAELEEARKVILQLSQVNAKPAPPIPSPAKVPAAEPELAQSTQPDQAKPKQAIEPKSAIRRQPSSLPSRYPLNPVGSGTQPPPSETSKQDSKLSDTDMGWVD